MRVPVSALLLVLAVTTVAAQEPADDQSAIATVAAFDNALLAAMHHRSAPLESAIDSAFNVPVMAATIVGPHWSSMTAEQHDSVATAMRSYLLARFASEFDSYDGEQFQIEPAVQTRGPDKLVRTRITGSAGEATQLYYRLRSYQGRWRIIDVFYDGVSQLTTQRADLAAVAGDVPALLAQIRRSTPTVP